APGFEQHVRHAGDETAGGVARGQNCVELLQQLRPKIGLFFFRFLAQALGFFSRLAGLVRFHGQGLLLLLGRSACSIGFLACFFGILAGLIGLRLHTLRVSLGGLGRSAGLLRLDSRLLGFLAALGFSSSVQAGLGFAVFRGLLVRGGFGLGLFFGLLLYRHHARLFCGAHGLTRQGLHCALVAFLRVGFFRSL